MKNYMKLLAIILVLVMCMCGAAACSKTGARSEIPLVVGYSAFSGKFSPFFCESAYDTDVAQMTQVLLMTTDRVGGIVYNAIKGEKIEYNGTKYTYKGISDIKVDYDEASNITTYTAKIRSDVKFSDGHVMDADDIIFNYYVLLDNDYDGAATLNSVNIVGLTNYKYNSSAAESISSSITDEDVEAALANMSASVKAAINEELIAPTLTDEFSWASDNFEKYGGADAISFYVDCYNNDENYSFEGKSKETVIADMIAQYGSDYKLLSSAYEGSESYFDSDVFDIAKGVLLSEKLASGGGVEVPNIEGIKKLSKTEVEVKVNGYDAAAIYQIFGISVAPMHYYGSESLYDYDNNKFGFPRDDLSSIKSKTSEPMGAGPYKFVAYEDYVVYFEANDYYYKGVPATMYIQFKTTLDADKIPGIIQGTIDITDPSGTKKAFDEIKSSNSNGELSGDTIVTSRVSFLGYGYLGINAATVNVGGNISSKESKSLRSAFAVLFSVYRDVAIDSYYGEAASVINYPISNTSWAAPQKTDEGYKTAFSVDADGKDIYTSNMNQDQKYEAALNAAIGFLKAAGYTYDEGTKKFTAAPAGAKMAYEVIIPGEGKGGHPSFSIATNVSEVLGKIGITLAVNDPANTNILWEATDAGVQEMWAAAWGATIDPDMHQVYHSSNIVGLPNSTTSNHYHIQDADLDQLIMDARKSDNQAYRKTTYKACLDIIMDWAVEIPVYQKQNCVTFSPERVDMSTVTPDITTYWGWMNDIEKVLTIGTASDSGASDSGASDSGEDAGE